MRSISGKLSNIPDLDEVLEKVVKPREDTFSLRLETPMYGGGAKAGEADTERPVRVPSVRGHLRFWWRLLFAQGREDKELRDAESAIWGGVGSSEREARSSRVSITVNEVYSVKTLEKGQDFYGFKNKPQAYALFPAMANDVTLMNPGMAFTLRLSYHRDMKEDAVNEVRAAFAAWVYFGGLGARTRRGLGTLSCERADLAGGGKLPGLKEILAMNSEITLWLGAPESSGQRAWEKALKPYQEYRQFRTRKFGRSLWPEPDSIRQITGCSLKDSEHDHSTPLVQKDLIPSFPRASLGLPIIYHFKDEPRDFLPDMIHRSDPEQVQILPANTKNDEKGKESGRMASPVITKGLRDGKSWYPAVIILPRKAALNVRLSAVIGQDKGQDKRKRDLPLPPDVLGQRDARYAKLKPMPGADNAIEGFEKFISDENKSFGFKREA